MSRDFDGEFATVNLILGSECQTRAVDGFCLAWIKLERQLRKLTAYLLYQASQITVRDAGKLREAFYAHGSLDYTSFIVTGRLLPRRFRLDASDEFFVVYKAVEEVVPFLR